MSFFVLMRDLGNMYYFLTTRQRRTSPLLFTVVLLSRFDRGNYSDDTQQAVIHDSRSAMIHKSRLK